MVTHAISRRSFLTVSAMTAVSLALDWHSISAHAARMGPAQDYPTVIIGCYFKSEDKYTAVKTRQGESLIKKSIRQLTGELDPDRFWQIHRGTIVNVGFIDAVHRSFGGRLVLTLTGLPEKLPVSKSYAHLFRQM